MNTNTNTNTGLTISEFAQAQGAQPYEVAAFLNLGRDWTEDDEIDEETAVLLAETWTA